MDLEEKKKKKITRYSRIGKDAAQAKGGVADRTGKHVRMEVTACCPIQRQTPPPFIKRDKSSDNPEEETHCLPWMCQGFPVSKMACPFLWSLRV